MRQIKQKIQKARNLYISEYSIQNTKNKETLGKTYRIEEQQEHDKLRCHEKSKIFIDEKGRRLCFLKNQKQGATIFKGFKIIQGLKEKLQL